MSRGDEAFNRRDVLRTTAAVTGSVWGVSGIASASERTSGGSEESDCEECSIYPVEAKSGRHTEYYYMESGDVLFRKNLNDTRIDFDSLKIHNKSIKNIGSLDYIKLDEQTNREFEITTENGFFTIDDSAGKSIHPEDVGAFQEGVAGFSTFSGVNGSCCAAGTADNHGAAGVAIFWDFPINDLSAAVVGGGICELIPIPASSIILRAVLGGTCAAVGWALQRSLNGHFTSIAIVDDDSRCLPWVGGVPKVGVDYKSEWTTDPADFHSAGAFGPFHVIH